MEALKIISLVLIVVACIAAAVVCILSDHPWFALLFVLMTSCVHYRDGKGRK